MRKRFVDEIYIPCIINIYAYITYIYAHIAYIYAYITYIHLFTHHINACLYFISITIKGGRGSKLTSSGKLIDSISPQMLLSNPQDSDGKQTATSSTTSTTSRSTSQSSSSWLHLLSASLMYTQRSILSFLRYSSEMADEELGGYRIGSTAVRQPTSMPTGMMMI